MLATLWLLWAIPISAESVAPHPKITGLHNFRPELMLPDYNCAYLPESWFDFTADFLHSLKLFVETGSARMSGSKSMEADIEIWSNYAAAFKGRPTYVIDCPFANFVRRLCLWTTCKLLIKQLQDFTSDSNPLRASVMHCSELREEPIRLSRELFGRTDGAESDTSFGLRSSEQLVVFLNSSFAKWFLALVKRAAEAFRKMNIQHPAGARLECQDQVDAPSGWDWPTYFHRISLEFGENKMDTKSDKDALVVEGAVHFSLNSLAVQDMAQKASECPMGMLNILFHQLRLTLAGLTEQVTLTAFLTGDLMLHIELVAPEHDWILLAILMTQWPLTQNLENVALLIQARSSWMTEFGRYQNKPYLLDFHPSELIYPLDEQHQLPHGTTVAALKHRRNAWHRSESYAELMRALQTSLEHAEPLGGRPVVMFTMVYGKRYALYLPAWIQRSVSFKHQARTLIFCLDENMTKVCREHHPFPDLCVEGGVQTTANKFHFTSVVINSGFDVLYLDFDVILFRDPLVPVLKAAEKADLLLTRDFGTECINTGVVFMKSNKETARFLQDLIIWLWHHPYEFCQKAFAGIMGLEDVQWNEIFGEIVKPLPRWAFLDSLNAFVTSTIYGEGAMGWTGAEDQIVIYHFLDGTGGVDPEAAVRGYVNLFDLFYANDQLNLSDSATPLYVQDPQVQKQLDFSKLEPPRALQDCGHLEPEAYPAWKLRQRKILRERRDIRPIEL